MPIYEYQCDNCGLRFERTQKFSDPPVKVCPECRKRKVRKLLTPPGIVFKGSGWYATDHRSSSGRNSNKHSESSSASESKPAEKTESKPAASESASKSKSSDE